MARKKLYGAAAAARAKKLARTKRKRGSGRKRKSVTKAVKRRKARKTRVHTVKRRKARRVSTRKVNARARRRRAIARGRANPSPAAAGFKVAVPRRKKASAKRRRARKTHGGRPGTQASLLRARRAIRNRKLTPLGRATKLRYRMRSNPSGMMDLAMMILPIAGSLYGARAVSFKLAGKIPGLNRLPAQFQGPAMAAVLVGAGHFATKHVGALKKHRAGILMGTGLNLLDNLLSAFAPASVKAAFGLGDIYDSGLSDYVAVGEYNTINGTPINDDITLGDYMSVDGLQEDLGVEEELGLSEELGDSLSRQYLGGVSRGSMLKTIPQQPMLAAIPDRSFTKDVRHAGPGFDKADALYAGIFGGGF